MRNPTTDRLPLDDASFYVEELKYAEGDRKVKGVDEDEVARQLELLLRDAGIDSMTGAELLRATKFYGASISTAFLVPTPLAWSIWLDGLMHGVAFAAGLVGRTPAEVDS